VSGDRGGPLPLTRSRFGQPHPTAWVTSWVWRLPGWLGQTEQALQALEAWLAAHPLPAASTASSPSSLALRALAVRAHWLGELGRWACAAQQLQQLVVFEPERAAHWYNLGFVLEQAGEAVPAQAAFEHALGLAPRLDAAWLGLGKALARQGQWERAHDAWVCHAQRQPLCPDPLVCLVHMHAGRADWAAVTPWLDRLRRFEPRQAMALEAWMSTLPASADNAATVPSGPPGRPLCVA